MRRTVVVLAGAVVIFSVLAGALADYAQTQKRLADTRAPHVVSLERSVDQAVAQWGDKNVVFLGKSVLRIDTETPLQRGWERRRTWYAVGLGIVAALTASAVVVVPRSSN